jgi:hypothetical protein
MFARAVLRRAFCRAARVSHENYAGGSDASCCEEVARDEDACYNHTRVPSDIRNV